MSFTEKNNYFIEIKNDYCFSEYYFSIFSYDTSWLIDLEESGRLSNIYNNHSFKSCIYIYKLILESHVILYVFWLV